MSGRRVGLLSEPPHVTRLRARVDQLEVRLEEMDRKLLDERAEWRKQKNALSREKGHLRGELTVCKTKVHELRFELKAETMKANRLRERVDTLLGIRHTP